jgi:zinc protease
VHAAEVTPDPLKDSYAIIATEAVANDPAWRAATIEKLQAKYPHAKLFVWKQRLNEVLPAVRDLQPSFTVFVGKPEEMPRKMVMSAHYFSRLIDDDPYADTFWGLITGYDADAAGLVAGATDFEIERAMDCSGTDLKSFNEAWRYSEDHRGTMKYWKRGMADEEASTCDTDNTQGVLARLQKDKIQFLATSGHATEHDWQMGYCGPNMQMRHKHGALYAVDTKEQVWSATSTEPKVYLANGNCLIGHIDQVDCMALAWMRDGGVRQMMGYTVTTWFGAQGWGALGLYVDHAGLCTAAEAFHFTNASIVKTIEGYNLPDMRHWRWGKVGHMNMPMTRDMTIYSDEKAKTLKGDKQGLRALQVSGKLRGLCR